jgi:hypothetical protein
MKSYLILIHFCLSRHSNARPPFPWNPRASRSLTFSPESRSSEVAYHALYFLISYACSHKDFAHLLVKIYCLKVALSILSLQRVLSVHCVWQLVLWSVLNLRPSLWIRIETKPHESQLIIFSVSAFLSHRDLSPWFAARMLVVHRVMGTRVLLV